MPSVPVTAKAMLPSTSAVTIQLAHGVSMITFVNTVRVCVCVLCVCVFCVCVCVCVVCSVCVAG